MAYIRSANPIWHMVDLLGFSLNDEYYAHFLTNTIPYLPQLVYRDNQGIVPWSDPLQFLANGTLPNNLYFNDDTVYRIEIRRGPLQSDALIYEINDYVPGDGGAPDENNDGSQDNQASNPQFSQISFTSPITFSTAGTYEVAPGWDLVLTGSGTATVAQLVFTGVQDLPANPVPPYALRVTTNGWTTAILQQRFEGVGAIWANTFVSMSVLARSNDSVERALILRYVPNTPGTPIEITQGTLSTGIYETIQGVVALPTSTNNVLNNAAYVDMQIVLPGTGIVDLSNVQIMGQSELLPIDFASQPAETIERQIDHLFHYYKPQLAYKQIPNYLVGWDFALNPAQLNGRTIAVSAGGANSSYYAWDQTIVFQSANSAINITPDVLGGFTLTPAVTTQMAVIQYLDAKQLKKLITQKMSVNICAVATGSPIPVTVSLWYTTDASLPAISSPTFQSLVATLNSTGKPATFNGTWTEIKTENLQDATASIIPAGSFLDYPLSGFGPVSAANASTATYFAIVIGTASVTSPQSLLLQSVNLCAGDIPTRPAPQTYDEVLRECQYYYEKSYPELVPQGTATSAGAQQYTFLTATDSLGSVYNLYNQSWFLKFKQVKRVIPTMTFYTPGGTMNNLQIGMLSGNTYLTPDTALKTNPNAVAISAFAAASQSTHSIIYNPTSLSLQFTFAASAFGNTTFTLQGLIIYHYVADARLGVV